MFPIANLFSRSADRQFKAPQRLTRFRKVQQKMLQHGASDLSAQTAAEGGHGSKEVASVPVQKRSSGLPALSRKVSFITVTVSLG